MFLFANSFAIWCGLPQAGKILGWHPPPCPQCFSPAFFQLSPEQKVLYRYRKTGITRFRGKNRLEKCRCGRSDRYTGARRLLPLLSLFHYSYLRWPPERRASAGLGVNAGAAGTRCSGRSAGAATTCTYFNFISPNRYLPSSEGQRSVSNLSKWLPS